MDASTPLLEFFEQTKKATLAPSTAYDYGLQIRHFSRWFIASGGAPPPRLADLTEQNIGDACRFHARRLDTKRPDGEPKSHRKTADKIRVALSAIWRHAAMPSQGAILPPPGQIDRPKRTHRHPATAWTDEEFASILFGTSSLPGTSGPLAMPVFMEALIRVAYNSGFRIETLFRLPWRSVDFHRGTLNAPPEIIKDDEGQIVTLLPNTLAALSPLTTHGPRVFSCWPYAKRPLAYQLRKAIILGGLRGDDNLRASILASRSNNGAGLVEWVERAVDSRDLWQRIRRTYATHLYRKTGDLEYVREMMGHSDSKITRDHYIDKTIINRRTQADLLDDPTAAAVRIHRAS